MKLLDPDVDTSSVTPRWEVKMLVGGWKVTEVFGE